MSGKERRARSRYAVQRDMELRRGGHALHGTSENLSLGGALVRVEAGAHLAIGDRIEVSFALPELTDPVVVQAEVRWCTPLDPPTIGIQFVTGFRARETWALNRLLEHSEKLD